MRSKVFRAPGSGKDRSRRRGMRHAFAAGSILTAIVTVTGFAQMSQLSSRPTRPAVSPDINRIPDRNDQTEMLERRAQRHSFDAANVERLRELMQASEALQTLAMALKAKVDGPDKLSQNEVNKAETIEKLARIVKERMKLTVAAN